MYSKEEIVKIIEDELLTNDHLSPKLFSLLIQIRTESLEAMEKEKCQT